MKTPKPTCAVCGGPNPDGSGCEFCPAVTPEEIRRHDMQASSSTALVLANIHTS